LICIRIVFMGSICISHEFHMEYTCSYLCFSPILLGFHLCVQSGSTSVHLVSTWGSLMLGLPWDCISSCLGLTSVLPRILLCFTCASVGFYLDFTCVSVEFYQCSIGFHLGFTYTGSPLGLYSVVLGLTWVSPGIYLCFTCASVGFYLYFTCVSVGFYLCSLGFHLGFTYAGPRLGLYGGLSIEHKDKQRQIQHQQYHGQHQHHQYAVFAQLRLITCTCLLRCFCSSRNYRTFLLFYFYSFQPPFEQWQPCQCRSTAPSSLIVKTKLSPHLGNTGRVATCGGPS
jgi:hypothetical protein